MLIDALKSLFGISARKSAECPVCRNASPWLDSLDLNRSCEDRETQLFSPSGHKIDYHYCISCGFVFAPEMCAWEPQTFKRMIYNDDYAKADPEYVSIRPQGNARLLSELFPIPDKIRHLDYGGGNGELSRQLAAKGWNSTSFDPMTDERKLQTHSKFNLVTAFEVFEHHPRPQGMLEEISTQLADDGVVFFSTLVSDREALRPGALTWWYAAPRNGHVCLYSKQTLEILGRQFGLRYSSHTPLLHSYSRGKIPWANDLLQQSAAQRR